MEYTVCPLLRYILLRKEVGLRFEELGNTDFWHFFVFKIFCNYQENTKLILDLLPFNDLHVLEKALKFEWFLVPEKKENKRSEKNLSVFWSCFLNYTMK